MLESQRASLSPTSGASGIALSRPTYIPELDALRGAGALLILGHHLWPATFFVGWTRADLFFVLSGYLITTIILKHGAGARFLVTFWTRRVLRIWPAYYLLLAAIITKMYFDGERPPLSGLVCYATFTQNVPHYWTDVAPSFSSAAWQTWSLAIEEQFYLLWPVVALLVGRSFLIPVALWLMIASVTLRLNGMSFAVALARSDGLALGAILALFLSSGCKSATRTMSLNALLAFTGCIALFFVLSENPSATEERVLAGVVGTGALAVFAGNVLYLAIVGLVVNNSGHHSLAPLRWRPLRYIGQISYGVFLYHILIIKSVESLMRGQSIATDCVAIALSLSVAALSWECLEKPLCNLKHLMPYRDSARAIPPALG
jgi:peptidoglycan/LPS O-acetylase OafA/YrhL